jgi:hypothetical protein
LPATTNPNLLFIYVRDIAVLFLFVIMMLDGNLRKGGEAAFWAPFFSKDDYKLIEKAMRTCYAEEDSESIADFKASAPKTMAEISETLQNARRSLDCKLKITSEEIPGVSPEIIRKDREIDQNIDTLIQNSESEESFLTPETKDAFIGTFQNSADIHEGLVCVANAFDRGWRIDFPGHALPVPRCLEHSSVGFTADALVTQIVFLDNSGQTHIVDETVSWGKTNHTIPWWGNPGGGGNATPVPVDRVSSTITDDCGLQVTIGRSRSGDPLIIHQAILVRNDPNVIAGLVSQVVSLEDGQRKGVLSEKVIKLGSITSSFKSNTANLSFEQKMQLHDSIEQEKKLRVCATRAFEVALFYVIFM